ncbi:hypothetical protein CK224_30445 [Mesorhizobium sp. WSM3862]|nr:hypothetical protein CK224_30445 [Mesorhizobium sp. WSM3862]
MGIRMSAPGLRIWGSSPGDLLVAVAHDLAHHEDPARADQTTIDIARRDAMVNAVRGFGYPLPDHLGPAVRHRFPRSKTAAGPFYSLQAREHGRF